MISKKVTIIAGLLCVLLLSGCTNEKQTLKNENAQLKSQVAKLQQELTNVKNSPDTLKSISINYKDYSFKNRFVEKKSKILGLPYDQSIVLRPIESNTVVSVLDAASVGNDEWLYVTVPVYDSPVNMKGWIRESETLEYTKDRIKSVQSDVTLKPGADVYETDNFSNIKSTSPTKADSSDRGRIEEKREGYVCISCPGGRTIWVSEKSVVYPAVE